MYLFHSDGEIMMKQEHNQHKTDSHCASFCDPACIATKCLWEKVLYKYGHPRCLGLWHYTNSLDIIIIIVIIIIIIINILIGIADIG